MRVTRTAARGTATRKADVEELNWAGDNYRKIQQEHLTKVDKNLTIVLGRGGRTINLKDLPEPRKRPSTEGMVRITNRGTGSRKSTNMGTA
ncbi:MAG: hypothetical protein WAO91_09320 [Candidatus Nitrosotenuis sp.]